MRITESQLRRIIRQEVQALREGAAEDNQTIEDTLALAGRQGEDPTLWTVSNDGLVIHHQTTGEEINIETGEETPAPSAKYDAALASEKPVATPYKPRSYSGGGYPKRSSNPWEGYQQAQQSKRGNYGSRYGR